MTIEISSKHHCFLPQCTVEVVEYQMWLDWLPILFSATWMKGVKLASGRCDWGIFVISDTLSQNIWECVAENSHHCYLPQCTVEVVEYQMWLDDPNTFSATWMRCQTGFREVWLGYILCHFRHIISKYLGMCRGKMHHCFLPQCTVEVVEYQMWLDDPNTFSATWMRCQTGFREVWLGYICHFRHIISKYLGMCRGKMHHCFLPQCTMFSGQKVLVKFHFQHVYYGYFEAENLKTSTPTHYLALVETKRWK